MRKNANSILQSSLEIRTVFDLFDYFNLAVIDLSRIVCAELIVVKRLSKHTVDFD